jgi:hypothetical protein
VGEIAEAMLDGTLCEGCGEFMGEGSGFPQRCAGCQPDEDGFTAESTAPRRKVRKRGRNRGAHPCPLACGATFASPASAKQHSRDKHGTIIRAVRLAAPSAGPAIATSQVTTPAPKLFEGEAP